MIAYLNRITDHGGLTGLSDDDHTLYFKADGSRNLTGALVTSGKGIRPAADSTTAIQIQNSAGIDILNIDTTGSSIGNVTIKSISDTGRPGIKFQAIRKTAGGLAFGLFRLYGSVEGGSEGLLGAIGVLAGSTASTPRYLYLSALPSADYNAATVKIASDDKVGIAISGTADPTCTLSFGGNVTRKIWLERHTTDSTTGNNLTIQAGGCKASQTNIGGGTLLLSGAISTGTGESAVEIQTATAGASGTADNTPTTKLKITGSGALVMSGQGLRPSANSTTAIQIQQADGTAFGNWDSANKRLRIGDGNDPRGPLDILTDANNSIFLGDITNNSNKYGYIVVSQYTHTSEPEGVLIFGSYLSSTQNQIFYGGGASARNAATKLVFYTAADQTTRVGTARMSIFSNGNVGIGTSDDTNILNFPGDSAQKIWMARHTTDATAGNSLSVQAGGCKASQTNIGGGALNLNDGLGTGSGYGGGVFIRNYYAGGSGTADNSQIIVIQVRNNQIGFWNSTPAGKQTLAAYTSDTEGVAYTGIDNAQVGSVYAQVADLNTLRVAYDNLRAAFDDLRTKIVTSTFMATA